MISHILKQHVPFDRVPYSCSLCSFRCTDKQSLLDHLNKYSRHRDEEAKNGATDYNKILRMASNPYHIGDGDMAQLSRDDSIKWHSRHTSTQSENPLYDSEGLFEEEEEDVVMSGGRVLPKWLISGFGPAPAKMSSCAKPAMTPVPLNVAPQNSVPQHLYCSKLPRSVPVMPPSMETSTLPSNPAPHMEESNASYLNTSSLDLQTINANDIMGLTALLSTPQLTQKTPSQTPLQDENTMIHDFIQGNDYTYYLSLM